MARDLPSERPVFDRPRDTPGRDRLGDQHTIRQAARNRTSKGLGFRPAAKERGALGGFGRYLEGGILGIQGAKNLVSDVATEFGVTPRQIRETPHELVKQARGTIEAFQHPLRRAQQGGQLQVPTGKWPLRTGPTRSLAQGAKMKAQLAFYKKAMRGIERAPTGGGAAERFHEWTAANKPPVEGIAMRSQRRSADEMLRVQDQFARNRWVQEHVGAADADMRAMLIDPDVVELVERYRPESLGLLKGLYTTGANAAMKYQRPDTEGMDPANVDKFMEDPAFFTRASVADELQDIAKIPGGKAGKKNVEAYRRLLQAAQEIWERTPGREMSEQATYQAGDWLQPGKTYPWTSPTLDMLESARQRTRQAFGNRPPPRQNPRSPW